MTFLFEFAFQSIFHFIGTIVLLAVIFDGTVAILKALVK